MGRNVGAYTTIGIFLAIIAACVFMPPIVRGISNSVFEEFRAPLDTIPAQLRDLEVFWLKNANSKNKLQEAGRDLARINAANELKLRQYNENLGELERYKNLLDLPSYVEYRGEIARVVRRDMNAWWQQIYIRKGSKHGIKPGYGVVYGGGVVGRISEVIDENLSVVELVSSVDFRMAAQFEGDDRPVIYQGSGGTLIFQRAKGFVRDVPTDVNTNIPRRLITSSLAGTFPAGLPIGDVRELVLDVDELFKTGLVDLSVNLSSINEVMVLIPLKKDDGS